MKTYWGMGV